MAIYQTAHYRVNEAGVDEVKAAIVEFVDHVRASEPGTRLYAAWQQASGEPTRPCSTCGVRRPSSAIGIRRLGRDLRRRGDDLQTDGGDIVATYDGHMRIDRTAPVPSASNPQARHDSELRHRLAGRRIEDPSVAELQSLARSRADEAPVATSRRRRGR
jgi:hypothetical protein